MVKLLALLNILIELIINVPCFLASAKEQSQKVVASILNVLCNLSKFIIILLIHLELPNNSINNHTKPNFLINGNKIKQIPKLVQCLKNTLINYHIFMVNLQINYLTMVN
jgi:hypothetical protein